ncbi:MAG: GNAT family N-acetyltransferase [Pseudomonadota bacterium]
MLSETEFLCAEKQWQELLASSDADPLFSSWYWASAWWQKIREANGNGAKLRLFLITNDDDQWLALAPCHLVLSELFRRPVNQLHLIGSGLPRGNLFRAEYRSLLLNREHADELLPVLLAQINQNTEWDECFVGDLPKTTHLYGHYEQHLGTYGWFARETTSERGYSVSLKAGFKSYLMGISGSARRQVFNKRRRLEGDGQVTVVGPPELTLLDACQQLNAFHRERWNADAISTDQLRFLERACSLPGADTPRLAHSALRVEERVIGVLIDIVVDRRQYNIQLGFDEHYDRALSPGLLHLGYVMEHGSSNEIDRYEFLIGDGLTQNYKARFASQVIPVTSLHIVRTRWLRVLHRCYQALRPGSSSRSRTAS